MIPQEEVTEMIIENKLVVMKSIKEIVDSEHFSDNKNTTL